MGGGALEALTEGRQAPAGYQLSTDRVVVVSDHGSVDLGSIDGVKSVRPGRYAQVELATSATASTLAALRQAGRLLPTFTDGRGRISAATGRIVVVAPTGLAKSRAAEVAAVHGMGTMRTIRYGAGLQLIDGTDGFRALDALAALRAAGLDAELDMLRYHRFLVAGYWTPEYGSADDPEQFEYLAAYSPYHHVVAGTRYPAVMFVTGDADTRVAPLHARKMTALLQAETGSSEPVVLLYNANAARTASAAIDELTAQLRFLLWKTQ